MNIQKNYILEPTNCCLYEKEENLQKICAQVQIYEVEIEFQKTIKLEVGNYNIIINKNSTFVQIQKQLYYFKQFDNKYPIAIEIFQNQENFYQILNEICDLQEADDDNKQYLFNTQELRSNIEYGGQRIGGSLQYFGEYIGQRIENAGGYIAKNVKPNEQEVEVSPKIQDGLKNGKVIVTNAATYTSDIIQTGLGAAKNIGYEIYNKIPENQTFNNIKQSENFDTAKNIGLGAVKGGANIIGGVYNGFVNVANGFGKATQNVITQKYGQQAGEVVEHSRDIVNAAVQIDFSVKNAIIKDLQTKSQN